MATRTWETRILELAEGDDTWKELVNKLAWALGTTFGLDYRSKLSPIRHAAIRVAVHIRDKGLRIQVKVPGE